MYVHTYVMWHFDELNCEGQDLASWHFVAFTSNSPTCMHRFHCSAYFISKKADTNADSYPLVSGPYVYVYTHSPGQDLVHSWDGRRRSNV